MGPARSVATATLLSVFLLGCVSELPTSSRPGGLIPAAAKKMVLVRVVDGDTVVVSEDVRIRLHGIDSPEWNQPYGADATAALNRLVSNDIYVTVHDTDRYGRLVGEIWNTDGVNVNLRLVCDGYAWWYEKYAPDEFEYSECQESARAQQLGLWADEKPTAPWDWRRRK